MTRKSSIDTLPPDILEQLQALLRDPRCTQLDVTARINALLEEGGHEERISKSALNRYSQRMEQVGARIRQGREIAQMWIGQLGNVPQGQLGQLLNEMVRNLAFETAMHAAEGEEPMAPKALKELCIGLEKLEKASSLNEERERKIKEEAKREAQAAAAEVAAETAKQAGVSPETIARIRRDVLGMAA